jgi:Ala-tRNA(Pro) deacylase
VDRAGALLQLADEALDAQPEVYFEAGDHEHLVHMTQAEFLRLTADAPRAHFSRPD